MLQLKMTSLLQQSANTLLYNRPRILYRLIPASFSLTQHRFRRRLPPPIVSLRRRPVEIPGYFNPWSTLTVKEDPLLSIPEPDPRLRRFMGDEPHPETAIFPGNCCTKISRKYIMNLYSKLREVKKHHTAQYSRPHFIAVRNIDHH